MQSKTFVSLAGFAALLGLSTPAHAYLDPATGSIILQATIGAIASATFFFRTSLYRVKELFVRSKQPGAEQE
ncbi:hypothetical protein J4558_05780 [Leptolyngbya sp. 15MV]|nr:hypothetical protein J4558_05780 [Leptolyngbya sp. 15MV]